MKAGFHAPGDGRPSPARHAPVRGGLGPRLQPSWAVFHHLPHPLASTGGYAVCAGRGAWAKARPVLQSPLSWRLADVNWECLEIRCESGVRHALTGHGFFSFGDDVVNNQGRPPRICINHILSKALEKPGRQFCKETRHKIRLRED